MKRWYQYNLVVYCRIATGPVKLTMVVALTLDAMQLGLCHQDYDISNLNYFQSGFLEGKRRSRAVRTGPSYHDW